ncbi:MAG TPA: hypothetical protein PLC42_03235 [Parachlamydiaceae bacterium]|nr:hypothetical protein [Parachlamydiaceae bacterium]
MPITGSGLGDEAGNSSIQFGPRELEATAFTFFNRASLGIVKDSLEVSFMQLGGNLWKYNSAASRPVLAPLIQARVNATLKEISERSWDAFFEELRKNLPADTADRLLRERAKAKEDRSPSYIALEEILVSSAKTLAMIREAAKADSPNSAAAQTALFNIAIAANSATTMAEIGTEFFKEAHSFLDAQGSNYIYHDLLSQNVNAAEKELNRMQAIKGS